MLEDENFDENQTLYRIPYDKWSNMYYLILSNHPDCKTYCKYHHKN